MKKVRATYSLEADSYILDFDYTYYYSLESHLNPPESELEITQVYLNKEDITDFYFNIKSCNFVKFKFNKKDKAPAPLTCPKCAENLISELNYFGEYSVENKICTKCHYSSSVYYDKNIINPKI